MTLNRLLEGEHHGMRRAARVAERQLLVPPIQQRQAAMVLHFVGKIIGPATIGVKIVEILPQGTR